MSLSSSQVVQKLWHYCNLLRDDGLSYPDYVEQLTFLIFLKMADELRASGKETPDIPEKFAWPALLRRQGSDLHGHYGISLAALGRRSGMVGLIFKGAKNRIRDPDKLRRLVVELVDKEQWTSVDADVKGEAYEGLLEKTAKDTKSGAGQYFTPRPLIRAIVQVTEPGILETICDPACGTCGFLLAAREFITSTHLKPTKREIVHQQLHAYHGFELVDSVARLGAMNLVLHGIGPVGAEAPPPITIGDSLSIQTPKRFDLVLTNPPFGKKSSVKITHEIGAKPQALVANRSDFWATTANKQLNFLQHIASILSETGRAAVVLPDNTLFEGGAGEKVRRRLLKDFDVHTLLRLPSGIFYAQGVKANVLFFDRLTLKMRGRPRRLWVYDFRTNNHFTLKNKQLAQSDLDEFVRCYSADDRMARRSTWLPHNPGGRWRSFTYEELLERQHCSFDVCWLRNDQLIDRNTLPSPSQLGKQIAVDLRNALRNIERAIR